jgi:hypothetical protein
MRQLPHLCQASLRPLMPYRATAGPPSARVPQPFGTLPLEDRVSEAPVEPEQLGVHRPLRLPAGGGDGALELFEQVGVAVGQHGFRGAHGRRSAVAVTSGWGQTRPRFPASVNGRHVVAVDEIPWEVFSANGPKPGLEHHSPCSLFAPHGSQAHPLVGERDRHAVHD